MDASFIVNTLIQQYIDPVVGGESPFEGSVDLNLVPAVHWCQQRVIKGGVKWIVEVEGVSFSGRI